MPLGASSFGNKMVALRLCAVETQTHTCFNRNPNSTEQYVQKSICIVESSSNNAYPTKQKHNTCTIPQNPSVHHLMMDLCVTMMKVPIYVSILSSNSNSIDRDASRHITTRIQIEIGFLLFGIANTFRDKLISLFTSQLYRFHATKE